MPARQTTIPERSANHGKEQKLAVSKEDRKKAMNCLEYWEDPEHLAQNQEAYKKFKSQVQKSAGTLDGKQQSDTATSTTLKRQGHGANGPETVPNKRQKSEGRQDSPTGAAGDISRVPSKGQKVQWHTVAGYVDGEVVEVVYEEKKVDGKNVKATKEDPRVVLKSDVSGKTVVHKPEAVFWN